MKRGCEYLVLSLVVFMTDQATKCFVRKFVGPFDIIHVLPVLNFVSIQNWASAFGLFRFLGNIFFIVVAACASVFVAILIVKGHDNRTAFSLILGGATGNLADRIIYGRVIDFLDVHVGKYHLPAFNLADSALIVGISLLLLQSVVQLWELRHK
jgi:signal peptidase II